MSDAGLVIGLIIACIVAILLVLCVARSIIKDKKVRTPPNKHHSELGSELCSIGVKSRLKMSVAPGVKYRALKVAQDPQSDRED